MSRTPPTPPQLRGRTSSSSARHPPPPTSRSPPHPRPPPPAAEASCAGCGGSSPPSLPARRPPLTPPSSSSSPIDRYACERQTMTCAPLLGRGDTHSSHSLSNARRSKSGTLRHVLYNKKKERNSPRSHSHEDDPPRNRKFLYSTSTCLPPVSCKEKERRPPFPHC
mmetsp:Transcript_33566/g.107249  ORF Transcript_33566/g.107249 Transcript_33566/m.107249 type:complete len:166 (-) Transcript_33566:35-532(-)